MEKNILNERNLSEGETMVKEEAKTELLQVKYDDLFHQLFNENEIQTLEWVVMQILGCKFDDIKGKVVVKKNSKIKDIKKKYVDLVINYKNERVMIKLNFGHDENYPKTLGIFFKEILSFYASDDFDYTKIIRAILINLNWFFEDVPSKQECEIAYPDWCIKGNILKTINVNLSAYDKLCYNQIQDEDKFYKLLTLKTKEDLDSLTSEENMLKSYSNKIINLSKNDEYRKKVMNERIEANLLRQES